MIRRFLAVCALFFIAACGADHTRDPDERVMAARHVAAEPPSITLFTTINDRNGTGAHSALLINGSERVLFDPAGNWQHPHVPVQEDVHYGMSDRMVAFYIDYQARDNPKEKFHVIEQKLNLPAAQVEAILQAAKLNGSVPKAHCANSISGLLRSQPGFEAIGRTWFPKSLSRDFARLPNVKTQIFTEENDNLYNHGVIMVDDDGNRVND